MDLTRAVSTLGVARGQTERTFNWPVPKPSANSFIELRDFALSTKFADRRFGTSS